MEKFSVSFPLSELDTMAVVDPTASEQGLVLFGQNLKATSSWHFEVNSAHHQES